MKVNYFFILIGALIALLMGFWVFSIAEGKDNDMLCGVCSTVCFLSTVIAMLAVKPDSARMAVNLKVLSTVFFLLFVVSHFCFALFGIRMPYYVIINALALLIFFALYYWMVKRSASV